MRNKMKMMIDEAITWLNTDDFESKGFADATSVAIDTMRKYEKIKQIIENWENSGEEDDPMNIIDNIEEVLEDATN